MPRKKVPTAEIVPALEGALVPLQKRESPQEMIERLVRERVDEIMVKLEAGQHEPGFIPRDEADELRRRRDVFERRKWSIYFDKWGCRVCARKNVSHYGTGHCQRCYMVIQSRLKQIKAEWDESRPDAEIDRQIDRLTSRFRVAKSLLNRGDE